MREEPGPAQRFFVNDLNGPLYILNKTTPIHELGIWWDDPADRPNRGRRLFPTMALIVAAGYHARGGKDPDLPGNLLSKSDGMIRAVTGVVPRKR